MNGAAHLKCQSEIPQMNFRHRMQVEKMLAICTYIHTYACFFFCAEGAENNKISQPLQKRVEQMKSLVDL